jgi:hypothetical protein
MNISNTYRTYLEAKIIKEFLVQGIKPTKSQVDERLEQFEEENPGLTMPFTTSSQYEVADSEESSASKVNQTFLSLHDDLSVVYKALLEQSRMVTDTFDSISTELNLIKKRTSDLESKSSSLLFFAPDSEGSLDFVADYFNSKDKIDDLRTSCLVDTATTRVTLPAKTFSRVNLQPSSADVQFNVLTRNDFISSTAAEGSGVLNAFGDGDESWLQKITMRRGVGEVIAELMLRIPQGASEINKVVIGPSSSDEGNITSVAVHYSENGLNWTSVDASPARLIGDTSIVFSTQKAAYWKFVFTKAGFDDYSNGAYTYEFGAKYINLYGISYGNATNETRGILYSNALSPETGVSFNKASLSVCELLPQSSVINYSIAGLTESQLNQYALGTLDPETLAFIAVEPQEREIKYNPSVIDFSKVDVETGHSVRYQVNNSITYKNQNLNSVALDYSIPTDVVKQQVKVLRNVADNSVNKFVNEIEAGWDFDGTYYTTRVYVSQDAGLSINLGETEASINDTLLTGRINIPAGYHKFSTHKDNWRKIDFNDLVEAGIADPLYPFNHKYLVEGIGDFLYGVDLSTTLGPDTYASLIDPDNLYVGVDLNWEVTMEHTTNFDFMSNIESDNYRAYSFTKDFAGGDRILVKYNPEQSLMADESFAIITRSVSGDLLKALILKAEFLSEDPKLTPVLDEYVVKLGY